MVSYFATVLMKFEKSIKKYIFSKKKELLLCILFFAWWLAFVDHGYAFPTWADALVYFSTIR